MEFWVADTAAQSLICKSRSGLSEGSMTELLLADLHVV